MRHPCGAAEPEGGSSRAVVAAAKVTRGDLSQKAAFDAELRPWQEIELHARITGYLDTLKVDAGDLVKEDQLIATLEQPEMKSEIDHAIASQRRSKAEIEHAQANYDDAHLAFTRMTAVDKAQPNLLAQQDIDVAKAKDRAAAAALNAAKEQDHVSEADVKKLRVMEAYTKITAPFTGVITKRYSDPGALIQAGTSTGSLPVVRLSQNDKLRAVFPVSVSYVSRIKVGDPVEIKVDSTLNRTISGKVARFSRKVETSTRTMDVEVDVPNADLSLVPGIYATALLTIEARKDVLSVPLEAVARDKTGAATLYVVGQGDKIEERKVKLGLETPDRIEVLEGASENERVLTSSRALVKPGEVVEAKVIETTPPTTEAKAAAATASH
ncbi:MAG TPA: efflux RND transporter periplasmic adaptor subunit [Verrucomicrobiaceae bacterium]|jgi:RND family efflux transporter MFP subunit